MNMSRLIAVLIALCVLNLVVPVRAETEYVGVFSDATAGTCSFTDNGPREQLVYIVHKNSPGASALQFRVRPSEGFTGSLLSETIHHFSIGSVVSGIAVSYGECKESDVLVATLRYTLGGTSTPCSFLEIVPDSALQSIVAVDCNVMPTERVIDGGRLYVNQDSSCSCAGMSQGLPTPPSEIQFAAQEASMEFGVPEDLLLAVSHARSYWQHDGGVPDRIGFRGVMGLNGETLSRASTMLGVPFDSVAVVLRHNIRGYAALLRAEFILVYGAARYPERRRFISDWAVPVHQASGYHTPEAKGIYIRLVNRYLMRRGIVTGPQWSTLEHSRIQPHSGDAFCFDANEQPDYYCLTDDFRPAHPDNWRTRKNCTEGSPACEGLDPEPILHVVIHTSQSNTYQGVLDHFALEDQYWVDDKGNLHPSNVSAHYVVGFEGEIGQSVCEKDDANHIGSRITRNGELIESRRISIGIEHQGKVESGPFPTTLQYQTTAGLVRYLCDKYSIPKTRDHIWGHGEHPGASGHTDPAPHWDWCIFMDLVSDPSNPCEGRLAQVEEPIVADCGGGGGGGGGGGNWPGWPPNDDGNDNPYDGWEDISAAGCALAILGIIKEFVPGWLGGGGENNNMELWFDRFVQIRDFRDAFLRGDPVGQSIIDTYYRHSPEMFTIFLKDRGTAVRALDLVQRHTQDLVRLQQGEDWIMDDQTRRSAIGVLSALAAQGSPELEADLSSLTLALKNEDSGSVIAAYENLGGKAPRRSQPKVVTLWQNTPNPFNPVTTLRFFLPSAADVELVIYDVAGKKIATLVEGWRSSGEHRVEWNPGNTASGVYFARLKTPTSTLSQKMVLLK